MDPSPTSQTEWRPASCSGREGSEEAQRSRSSTLPRKEASTRPRAPSAMTTPKPRAVATRSVPAHAWARGHRFVGAPHWTVVAPTSTFVSAACHDKLQYSPPHPRSGLRSVRAGKGSRALSSSRARIHSRPTPQSLSVVGAVIKSVEEEPPPITLTSSSSMGGRG